MKKSQKFILALAATGLLIGWFLPDLISTDEDTKKITGKKLDYKELFNGLDLNGWIVYGTEKWYVEDGLLVCESGPDAQYGYLGTEDFYKNFVLNLEFKQESNGNSGVFFRSTVEEPK